MNICTQKPVKRIQLFSLPVRLISFWFCFFHEMRLWFQNLPASESKQNSGRNVAAGSMKEKVPVAEAGREHEGNAGRHRRERGCQRLKAEQSGKERRMKREAPVTGQRKVRLFLLPVPAAAGCPSPHQLKHFDEINTHRRRWVSRCYCSSPGEKTDKTDFECECVFTVQSGGLQ